MNKKMLIIGLMLTGALIGWTIFVVVGPVISSAEDDDDAGEDDPQEYDISLETRDATMISTGFATLNGELIDMGGNSEVEVYFVWGENPGEYTEETPKQTMTSPGEFSAEITDLFIPGNTYYFQARADPEGSGEEVSFYVY